jgi:hypothetical protein
MNTTTVVFQTPIAFSYDSGVDDGATNTIKASQRRRILLEAPTACCGPRIESRRAVFFVLVLLFRQVCRYMALSVVILVRHNSQLDIAMIYSHLW